MLGLLAIGSVCALIACGGGGAAAPPSGSSKLAAPTSIVLLTLDPTTLSVSVNDQAQFTAALSGGSANSSGIGWSALKGTITSSGLYTAPANAGNDTVTAYLIQSPSTFATAAVTVTAVSASNPVAPAPVELPPVAPKVTGPVELQTSSGPYTASVVLDQGLSVEWAITGGTILHGAGLDTVQFETGIDPNVTLTCTVSNSAGSATSSWWMVALPFAPRNHLSDLKASLIANGAAIEREVTSGDPAVYYATSYYLHGLAAAAEATADTQVMDALVGYVTQMMAAAKPLVRNGVTYQEWGPWDANGNPQQLVTFQGTGPLARTAAIIANNPTFLARYGGKLPQIVAFVDQSIFKYWFDKQAGIYANPASSWLGGYVPWLSTTQGGWGLASDAAFWNDKCSHLGMMSAWMYQATKNPLYLEYATRIAKGFRTHVTVVNGCWVWDRGTVAASVDDNNHEGSPDTSHANREPMMVAAMYEAGIQFQLADLQAIAATFTDIIWNQSQSSPMFSNYINGGNSAYGTGGAWTNGNIYHGWNMIGKYSPKALWVLAVTDQIIQTGGASLNASMPTNASTYGQIEMAGTQVLNTTR